MAKVLLINPSYFSTYGSSKASIVNPIMPTLGLATIAGEALRRGHKVVLEDLSYRPYDYRQVAQKIREEQPDIVGITATTPLMNQLRDISVLCKSIAPQARVVGGGAHLSAMPRESVEESCLDVAIVGEGDDAFGEICDGRSLGDVLGICYRDEEGMIHQTAPRPLLEDLDRLAMPAWHLYDPLFYSDKVSRLLVRRPPAVMMEFSRGCIYGCDFCASKMTMGKGYRRKSPKRCALEAQHLASLGFREFMLADDIFSTDSRWATEVCRAIARSGVDLAWSCTNGIRVESADRALFQAMKSAGCYRVSFGFESGSDAVLKSFGKGGRASLEQGRRAVRLAQEAGLDVNGYFLLGLSGDNKESMDETIDFARSLPLDMLKFGVTIAFPGTPMFHQYARAGLIRSYDWDDYHVYTEEPLFAHKKLKYEDINQFMQKAYRRAILGNPWFWGRRLWHGFKSGGFFWDVYYFFKFFLLTASNTSRDLNRYFAKQRWPVYNFREKVWDEAGPVPVLAKKTP